METVIEMAIALLIVGVLFPIALQSIAVWTNITGVVGTMFTVLLPVLAVIGVALEFMPKLHQG